MHAYNCDKNFFIHQTNRKSPSRNAIYMLAWANICLCGREGKNASIRWIISLIEFSKAIVLLVVYDSLRKLPTSLHTLIWIPCMCVFWTRCECKYIWDVYHLKVFRCLPPTRSFSFYLFPFCRYSPEWHTHIYLWSFSGKHKAFSKDRDSLSSHLISTLLVSPCDSQTGAV